MNLKEWQVARRSFLKSPENLAAEAQIMNINIFMMQYNRGLMTAPEFVDQVRDIVLGD